MLSDNLGSERVAQRHYSADSIFKIPAWKSQNDLICNYLLSKSEPEKGSLFLSEHFLESLLVYNSHAEFFCTSEL